jgi:phosphoserine phosphatase RsbX
VPDADCYMVRIPLTGRDDECGDAGVIEAREGERFLALVDALGHGRSAHEVAIRAVEHLKRNCHEDLVALLAGLHECLKGSGGAVAACCRLQLATGELRCAGMGNITVRVLGPRAARFVLRDGILGHMISSPREETSALLPGDVLILHSDGIQEHFAAWECDALLTNAVETIAAGLVCRYGKRNDDASCIVLRYLA